MNALYRFIHIILIPLLYIFFPVKFIGRENLPKEGGLILCSNHISYIDPMFLIMGFKRQICFMAKEELFRPLLIGAFLRGLGTFAVRRGAGDQGALQRAVELVDEGRILGIYAEGTRSKDGVPKRAKSGVAIIAARTGADVLPVAVCTKNGGKMRPFRRTKILVGKPIPNSELRVTGTDRAEIRAAADKIMGAVYALWEQGTGVRRQESGVR